MSVFFRTAVASGFVMCSLTVMFNSDAYSPLWFVGVMSVPIALYLFVLVVLRNDREARWTETHRPVS